jgi:DNA-binding response OmpR family regulator
MTKVLLVEDEPDVLETLAEILAINGFEVLTARDGLDAIESGKIGQVDIVVSDIRMPRMDGVELYRRAVGQRPDLPFLFISGHTVGVPQLAGVKPPMLLHKPVSGAAIVAAIQETLKRS